MKDASTWVLRDLFSPDPRKKELINYLQRHFNEDEPVQKLQTLTEGRDLALQYDEHWLGLYFEHRRLQVILYEIGNYINGLDEVVRITVESRKPIYENHPQRVCIHKDLISAYSEIDPHGHVETISNALDYMATRVEPDLQCYFCLQKARGDFYLRLNQLEAARDISEHYLNASQTTGTPYEQVRACLLLCELSYIGKNWNELMKWAKEAERLTQEQDDDEKWNQFRIEHMAWQTLASFYQGNETEAYKYHQGAVARAGHLKIQLPDSYYDAICAYHEAGGELIKALAMRQQQNKELTGTGRNFKEYKNLYEIGRLMIKAGQSADDILQRAEMTVAKLKRSETYLTELNKLRSGTGV